MTDTAVSDVDELLREITSRGLSISVVGADLRLQGPKQRVDAALVARIKAAKSDLVAHLTRAQGIDVASKAATAAEPEGFELTLLQRGYLVGRGEAVELGGVSSHIYHEIEGLWDLDRLEDSLRAVVARHGMLRTRFTAEGRQVELEQDCVDVRIGRLDLRGEPEERQQAELLARRAQWSHRVFPADHAPLLAADVTLLADERMILHVGHDGLIMDGISMFIFFRDWWAAYSADSAAAGDEPAPEEASFAAYVRALEAGRDRAPAQRSRAYWLDRLDSLPPHPDLPLRTNPASITRTRFIQHVATLDASQWSAVKSLAAARGLTPTALLFAAYTEVLARWGAGTNFTLATTIANRPPIHPRIANAIGNFSETMLVEVDLDHDVPFEDRARALQARLRKDMDNRHFSGIQVLRELGKRTGTAAARMPYTFNSAIGYVQDDVDGSTIELFGREIYTSSQTPQLWLNGFAFEQHGGVVVQFDEVSGLFPEGLVAAMISGYQTLLNSLAAGDEAWTATTFDLMPPEQRERRAKMNDTTVRRDEVRLPEAFIARAQANPDAPAIITEGATLTYGDLLQRASAAASWLRVNGVAREELVGLVMTRGPEQIVGILATLMAGGAYLPVDAGLPQARNEYMLADGRVRCVLTNAAWQDAADVAHAAHDAKYEVLHLDCAQPVGPAELVPPLEDAELDDLAYVLYTSGTTGEPKGVMISHRSVANVVADCNARFGINERDRFFGVSAFNFDLSVYDVFGALSAGAAIVLPEAGRSADPAHWLTLCEKAGVTVWNSVPAIVSLLHDQAAADGAEPLATLRLVMMSGDRIPAELPAKLRALDGKQNREVVSLGGPTETTIWNILHPVGREEDGSRPIPYGRPNSNNRAYILDARGQDTPDWVTGEIHAAGVGLARGYWNDEARTAERFFADAQRGERLYRTGDLGRYLPDGEIEILGRADFQIKVNGYRIEAGEVEARLVAVDAVAHAAVVRQSSAAEGSADAGTRGDRLVAHLVPSGAERPQVDEIRRALRVHLPEYMTPSTLVWHESLPLTRNGKVDRAKLAASDVVATSAAGSSAEPVETQSPETATERTLTGVWSSVLRRAESEIARDADFYDLGGDSLAAARILTAVRKAFGVGITLDRLYEVRTVRTMAAAVDALCAERRSRS